MQATIRPGRLAGSLLVPASKSHTVRALLLASLAGGESLVRNPLDSADARSCIGACRALGARIEPADADGGQALRVRGTAGRPESPRKSIDVGNSGTTLYLAAAVAALGSGEVSFTGDEQIRSRPAGNLLVALGELGARVECKDAPGRAPFSVRGPLKGGRTRIECPTSQYLSALLLAAPLCPQAVEIEVPLLYERPYVDMTLAWLDRLAVRYERRGYEWFAVGGRQSYPAFDLRVPGDFSSAAFFLCGAALSGSRISLRGLDMKDSQGDKRIVNVLEAMGCHLEFGEEEISIQGGPLRGLSIDLNDMPDALPALAVTACFARGETRLVNVPQARLKETDRIAVMAAELERLGARIEELPDGLVIQGGGLAGGSCDGHGDHRVVMALAAAGLGAEHGVTIEGAEAAAVTYPAFFRDLESLRPGEKNQIPGP